MGNINDLQEREDKTADENNSSNSDQESSISSDSSNQSLTAMCDRQTMQPCGDTAEIPPPPLLQQINNATIEVASTHREAVEDTEISFDDTGDDSFPLSESAIPASFEILEDLSPGPSDISDAFLTPDISHSDLGDGGKAKPLNSSLDSVDYQWKHERQIPKQSISGALKSEPSSLEPTKIAHSDSVSEEIDSIASLLRNLDLDEESSEHAPVENHHISPPFDDAIASEHNKYADSYESKNHTPGLSTPEELLLPMLTGEPRQVGFSLKHASSGIPTESSTEPLPTLVLPSCQPEATPNAVTCPETESSEQRDATQFVVPTEPLEDDNTSTSKKSSQEMRSESESQEQFHAIMTNYEPVCDTIYESTNTSDDISTDATNSIPCEISSNTLEDPCTTFESSATHSEFLDAGETRLILLIEFRNPEVKTSNMPTSSASGPSAFLQKTSLAPETDTESIRAIPLDKLHITLVPETDVSSDPMGLEFTTELTNSINTCAMGDMADDLETKVECTGASSDCIASARVTHMAASVSIEVPSPPRHTADKPNWALAPESSPNLENESNKKRRKRAPRRGRSSKPESGAQNSMLQSSKKDSLGAPTEMNPKSARGHLKGSGIPAGFGSTNDGSRRKKKSRLQAPDSPVVSYAGSPGHKDDKVAQPLPPSLVSRADSMSRHGVSPTNSGPTAGQDGSLKTDVSASSGPNHKPDVVSQGQMPLKNITRRLKEPCTNSCTIKGETRRSIPSRSFKHDLVGGNKESNPCDPVVTRSGHTSTNKQRSPIFHSSEEGSDRNDLFQSSIDVVTQSSKHHLDKCVPSGVNVGIPVPNHLAPNELDNSKTIIRPPQNNINSTEASINRSDTHAEWCYGESPNYGTRFSTALSLEPFAQSPLTKGRASPTTTKEVRYGTVRQSSLLRGIKVARPKGSLPRLMSSKGEERMAVDSTFTVATKTQHGASNESVTGSGRVPTARVNLPPKRSGSLPGLDRMHVDGQHGRSFQSNIPVATKRNASKDHAATPAPGPLLLQRAMYDSDLGLGNRTFFPDMCTPGPSSQNTFHTSGVAHIGHPTAQPYSSRATIDTVGYAARSGDALLQNRFTNSERRTKKMEPTPRSQIYGTNVGTQGTMYVFPTGESQGSMHHHQHNAAYRTQHRQHQFGNLQSCNPTTLGQPQTARFPTEFFHRTPQRVPLPRDLSDSYQRLPDYSNHSNPRNLR